MNQMQNKLDKLSFLCYLGNVIAQINIYNVYNNQFWMEIYHEAENLEYEIEIINESKPE